MSSDVLIRLVKISDAERLLEIYSPFVLQTAFSFESSPPSIEEFKNRILDYSSKAPWLVATIDNKIVGYAYSGPHRSRGSYRWSQETTVYVEEPFRKRGIARSLYTKLLTILKEMGFAKVLAIITLPNDASIGFHQNLGFKHIGEMNNIGYKFDRWHTTSWWDLDLQNEHFIPGDIKSVESIEHLLG